MRIITTLLATLLSILMVAAPVSTAACDLSCWLRATLPACHASNPAHPGQSQSMSMSPDMDMSGMAMGSANTGDSPTNDQSPVAVSIHTMPNMEMSADGIVQTAERRLGWKRTVKNVLLCMHEACNQSSASASTSASGENYSPSDRPQPASPSRSSVSPVYRIEVRTSPPDISATVSLATALRI